MRLGDAPSVVQRHARTLVQVHVGVAEEALGHTLHLSRILTGQLAQWHGQVACHLRTRLHPGNIESILVAWDLEMRTQLSQEGGLKGMQKYADYQKQQPVSLNVINVWLFLQDGFEQASDEGQTESQMIRESRTVRKSQSWSDRTTDSQSHMWSESHRQSNSQIIRAIDCQSQRWSVRVTDAQRFTMSRQSQTGRARDRQPEAQTGR